MNDAISTARLLAGTKTTVPIVIVSVIAGLNTNLGKAITTPSNLASRKTPVGVVIISIVSATPALIRILRLPIARSLKES